MTRYKKKKHQTRILRPKTVAKIKNSAVKWKEPWGRGWFNEILRFE